MTSSVLCCALALVAPRGIDAAAPKSVPAPATADEVEVRTPGEPDPPPPVRTADMPPPSQASGPHPAATPTVITKPADTRCFAARERCYRLTSIGIGLSALAGAAVGTGIGFLATKDELDEEDPRFLRSFKPAGAVLVGIGSGVLLIGVMMIVASQGAHRRGTIARRGLKWHF